MVSIYSTLEGSLSLSLSHTHTHARASPASPHRQGLLSTRPFFIPKKPPDERRRRRRGGRGSRSAEQVSREIRRARCLRRRSCTRALSRCCEKFRCLAGRFSPPRVRDPPAARLLSETKGEGKVSSISTAVRETKGVPLESTRSMGIPCFGYWTHVDSDNGCSSFIRLTN